VRAHAKLAKHGMEKPAGVASLSGSADAMLAAFLFAAISSCDL